MLYNIMSVCLLTQHKHAVQYSVSLSVSQLLRLQTTQTCCIIFCRAVCKHNTNMLYNILSVCLSVSFFSCTHNTKCCTIFCLSVCQTASLAANTTQPCCTIFCLSVCLSVSFFSCTHNTNMLYNILSVSLQETVQKLINCHSLHGVRPGQAV
jgi:hypothetical protein